ncbi:MAG TPA: hypothetical protein VD794_09255 [Flavisolibacter sp.]|nr:hypothetical protein [Flavisolibacter sp.]
MRSPELTLTTETAILDFIDQQPEEVPTLPLKIIRDQQEFEKIVSTLKNEHEILKPKGIFF